VPRMTLRSTFGSAGPRSRSMSVVATPTSISTAWVACQSGWPMKVAALKYEARSFAGFDISQCLPF